MWLWGYNEYNSRQTNKEVGGYEMICPNCKTILNLDGLDETISTLETRKYHCNSCKIHYKRYISRNSLGLIKHDALYELDTDGYPVAAWD